MMNDFSSCLAVMTPDDIKSIVKDALREIFPQPLFVEEKEDEQYLTREKVAEMLGVNLTTLWRWAKDKSLPCVKTGRYVRYNLATVRQFMKLHEDR